MAYTKIKLEAAAPIARIHLVHGSQNVIDIEMMEELRAALADIEARADISATVFSGGEKAFSAGADIAAQTPNKIATMLEEVPALIPANVLTLMVVVAEDHRRSFGVGSVLAL